MMLASLRDGYRAAVFGASGGIGGALVQTLDQDPRCSFVHAGSRHAQPSTPPKVQPFAFDLGDEGSIDAAAALLLEAGGPDIVIVATGRLHAAGMQPEKTMRSLDRSVMEQSFGVNAIGPALIAQRILPRLPRDRRTVFAALSARVGSISDNRLGGWYSYRASKAALNMLIRCFAIELKRTHPQAVCVGLHPGTVDSALSRPFQTGLSADRIFSPVTAAEQLISVIDSLTPECSGRLFGWDGKEIMP